MVQDRSCARFPRGSSASLSACRTAGTSNVETGPFRKKGCLVDVEEFGGGRLGHRVIADRGRTVVVCSEEEYTSASRDGRDPNGVGFPPVDVRLVASSPH